MAKGNGLENSIRKLLEGKDSTPAKDKAKRSIRQADTDVTWDDDFIYIKVPKNLTRNAKGVSLASSFMYYDHDKGKWTTERPAKVGRFDISKYAVSKAKVPYKGKDKVVKVEYNVQVFENDYGDEE